MMYFCVFQLLFQSQNPGLVFEYTVTDENATDTHIPEFTWKYMDWAHCTASCGGGENQLEDCRTLNICSCS